MKTSVLFLCLSAMIMVCSCTTSAPQQSFHNTDNAALIIKSMNIRSSQVIAPKLLAEADNSQTLDQLREFAGGKTAIVILENYADTEAGSDFRNRGQAWFMGLRGLGFQHIVFVRGNGVTDPNGLPVVAEYF